MAIIVSLVTLPSGLIKDNAYARIDGINGTKDQLSLTLNYYINQEGFSEGKAVLKQEQYDFEPSVEEGSDNFIKQGYEYLKTLPSFSEAIDA